MILQKIEKFEKIEKLCGKLEKDENTTLLKYPTIYYQYF